MKVIALALIVPKPREKILLCNEMEQKIETDSGISS